MTNTYTRTGGGRRLRTLGLWVIACSVGCYVIAKWRPWERVFGAAIAKGTHELTATGFVELNWQNERALAMRSAILAGNPDVYDIELSGPGGTEFLGLSTRTRPAPGSYPIVAKLTRGRVYDAMLESIAGRFDHADSGRIVFRAASPGLDASYLVYMTGEAPRGVRKGGQVVIRGTFHLQ